MPYVAKVKCRGSENRQGRPRWEKGSLKVDHARRSHSTLLLAFLVQLMAPIYLVYEHLSILILVWRYIRSPLFPQGILFKATTMKCRFPENGPNHVRGRNVYVCMKFLWTKGFERKRLKAPGRSSPGSNLPEILENDRTWWQASASPRSCRFVLAL